MKTNAANENNGLSDLSFAESQVTYLTLLTSPQEVYTTHFISLDKGTMGCIKSKFEDVLFLLNFIANE